MLGSDIAHCRPVILKPPETHGLGDGKNREMTQRVSSNDVERVAELANLELTADEITHMVKDLNSILDYVAELNELDTSALAPLAQISELADASLAGPMREDVPRPSLPRAIVTAQAPESDGAFFKVPKVIER